MPDLVECTCCFFPPSELHYCTGAYRISPTDVNSRPSSCLTNFLLNGKLDKLINLYLFILIYLHYSLVVYWSSVSCNVTEILDDFSKSPLQVSKWDLPVKTTGRSVLLEQPRKSGSKVISHMLSSHGGEIFLHVLNSNRSTLEDPPSISEGCGGRVTDYRITVSSAHRNCAEICNKIFLIVTDFILCVCFPQDFGEFMRENRLTPVSESSHDPSGKLPAERAKAQLERHTRYWPMIISQTTIFNMQAVSSILHFSLTRAVSTTL